MTRPEGKGDITGADPFLSQLRLGERALWNAPESAAVRDAAHGRSQRAAVLTSVVSTVAGGFMAWKTYESGIDWLAQPALPSALGALIWGAFAALTLRISVTSTQSYFLSSALHRIMRAEHTHYVVTDQRLFCVDENGALIDEIQRHEIVAVDLEKDSRAPAVLVERRNAEDEDKHLILMNLEQPHTAKAKIVETFLEPAP